MSGDSSPAVPAYWYGTGHAPNFNRSVALAHQAVQKAQEELLDALKLGYPHGREVTVIHGRGHFTGFVVGWDHVGCRVLVKNAASLKVSKWWAAHVQLTRSHTS